MNNSLELYIELYKRKEWGSIPIGIDPETKQLQYLTEKQLTALRLLFDGKVTFVGYGGAARSGKTVLECFWITFNALAYPDTGWFLGRKELKRLRLTVIKTLLKLFRFYGIEKDTDYKYDQKDSIISFHNSSEIFLLDLNSSPSDTEHLWTGGYEFTGGAADESNECSHSLILAINGRCGWRNNELYDIPACTLETFNPDKSHINRRYWLPYRDNKEKEHERFIRALPSDNPHPAVQKWVDNTIKTGDQKRIERLIKGNFDYDEDPSALVDYDAIMDLFTNDHVLPDRNKIITADLAMQGRDRFIAMYWDGLVGTVAIDQPKSTGKSIELDLKQLKVDRGVGNSQIIADSDGLGGYLESYIKNIRTFHGNGKAKNKKEFDNIKNECGFKLAELINQRKMKIVCNPSLVDTIAEEISASLKRDNLDADVSKKKLIPKQKVKESIGRSPDYFDNLLMRMVTEIRPKRRVK